MPIMQIEVLTQIADVPATQWNALVQDNNPFLRHEFLQALEQQGCVGERFGWLPRHLVVYNADGVLVAAMPLYEKHNSYGEFVFDHAWAEAYQRHGMAYFPKLVSSIPYSPVSGQRLLTTIGGEQEYYPVLIQAALHLAQRLNASSVHYLFPLAIQQDFLKAQGFIERHDCQFHWYNQSYQTFDDFLATLNPKKRKNIKQERRKVQDAGITLRRLNGYTATVMDWERFAFFYQHTFEKKWGMPTLNQGFFQTIAQALPEQIVLIMADNAAGECIAGSFMLRSDTRLYGRHWGCTEYIDSLHFEACYYQGVEYCIEHGLQVFEPGAQGEHKIPRGFIPTLTRSSHWLAQDVFYNAIVRHTQLEQQGVARYIQAVIEHSPYRPEVQPMPCPA